MIWAASKRQLNKVEFESRQKRHKESWADIGNDLLLLVSKAFPSLQDEAREELALSMLLASKAFPSAQDEAKEELALSKYLDQLKDPQVSFRVQQCKQYNGVGIFCCKICKQQSDASNAEGT